jgi:hypothetical protein
MMEAIVGIILIGAGILIEIVKAVLIAALLILTILHIRLAQRNLASKRE